MVDGLCRSRRSRDEFWRLNVSFLIAAALLATACDASGEAALTINSTGVEAALGPGRAYLLKDIYPGATAGAGPSPCIWLRWGARYSLP